MSMLGDRLQLPGQSHADRRQVRVRRLPQRPALALPLLPARRDSNNVARGGFELRDGRQLPRGGLRHRVQGLELETGRRLRAMGILRAVVRVPGMK